MLEIHPIRSSQERAQILSDFDPNQETLLVSDLRSKFEMQNQIIQRQGFFEDFSVLRASELWRLILRRAQPDMRLVSKDFLRTWLKHRLSDCELEVARHRGEETLLEFLELMFQVITHPLGSEQLSEWLEQNQTSLEKWGMWYDLSHAVGQELLQTRKIAPSWVASYLSNQPDWENHWQRKLVIDLGADLTRVESELLKTLSRNIDVQILMPVFSGDRKHKYLMNAYEELSGYAAVKNPVKKPVSPEISSNAQPTCLRFTGPLAEVKYLTQEVRKLLELRTNAHDIAVISNEIENYWPMIELFFKAEGIPVSKEGTFRLQSLPSMHWWLSRLRVASRTYEYPDLETSVYHGAGGQLRFEKFSALFVNLLDHEDLSRNASVMKAMTDENIPVDDIDLNYFIGVLTRCWPAEASIDHFEMVLKELLSVDDSQLRLKFAHWLFWLEQIVSKMEIQRSPGVRNGVQILPLSSADSANFTHRFYLGLTESGFRSKGSELVSAPEIEKIFRDTGFQLSNPESSSAQFQLEWLLSKSASQDRLLHPMTSFSGSIESPHSIWMEKSNPQKIPVTLPERNRLDALMSQREPQNLLDQSEWSKSWSLERAQSMQRRILQDRGAAEFSAVSLSEMPSLSASQLETFFQCPFKFAAGKLFHLLDEAQIDLDPDLRSLGSIVHKLFERLTLEPRRYDFTKTEIAGLLDEVSKNFILGDPRLWPPLREKYTILAFRFLEEEKSTATERKQTLFRELRFKKTIDDFQWAGSIDRVDELPDGSISLYDYKSSDRSYSVKSWMGNNHLQMAFYAWLIENHQIEELQNRALAGALYYIYGKFKKAGVHPGEMKEHDQLKENLVQVEQKMEIFKTALKQGQFAPKPSSVKECERCQWSQLCRAPHLNH